ncbi:uncharacterized protein LOC110182777 [Drosophila serrata]|uniref:uncharacterized protein LOC110182777 n=1 Tax=Drosophila serrata TaxID=7274 RepID=UPI000A1D1FC1|nr:uncharacterized protein LOC110182777 [Drosophila serrata]
MRSTNSQQFLMAIARLALSLSLFIERRLVGSIYSPEIAPPRLESTRNGSKRIETDRVDYRRSRIEGMIGGAPAVTAFSSTGFFPWRSLIWRVWVSTPNQKSEIRKPKSQTTETTGLSCNVSTFKKRSPEEVMVRQHFYSKRQPNPTASHFPIDSHQPQSTKLPRQTFFSFSCYPTLSVSFTKFSYNFL